MNSKYFVNPWVDFSVIGGVSILTYVIMLLSGRTESQTAVTVAAALTWICNNPHFAASSYRLYHSKNNIRQFPMTAILTPFIVLFGVIASLMNPVTVAPYFIKIFVLWSPYHFSGQTLGITLIYARRNGFQIGTWERRALSGFIFSIFASALITYDANAGSLDYYGIQYPSFGIPAILIPITKYFMYFMGAAVLFFVVRWSIRNKQIIPPIVLLPVATHFVWFQLGLNFPIFNELIPFFHSAQYMLVAWSVQMKERLAHQETVTKANMAQQTLLWMGLNCVFGYALFQLSPYLFPHSSSLDFYTVTGIVSAGIQMHHFFVDGVIWKLKNPSNASPLFTNVFDFSNTSATAAKKVSA